MNREEPRAGIVDENGLRAIAVVHVEVEHGHLLRAGRQRFKHGDGHGVEVTKAHRVIARRMVPRRPQEAEYRLSPSRCGQRLQRAADGAERMFENVRVRRRVAVEVFDGGFDAGQVLLGVSTEDGGLLHLGRFRPCNLQSGLRAQDFERAADPRGAFRVPRR